MITTNSKIGKKKQNGIALLVLVIVLALTLSTYYFTSISVVDIQIDRLEKTRNALKQAKQALINYAVMHADRRPAVDNVGEFGYLPCPHISDGLEGKQDGTCNGRYKNTIGYLPWYSLDTEVLKDGNGNCLWYAVSSSYKNSPNSLLINEDTNGMFQIVDSSGAVVKGNSPEDRVVAIIFSPGHLLDSQNRNFDATTNCGDDAANVAAYLDNDGTTSNATIDANEDKIDQFVHATLTSDAEGVPYNDYFITITREELWSAITVRSDFNDKMRNLTEALALCLRNYAMINGFNRLPWPAPIALADYRIDLNYDDTNASGYNGRLPFIVTDSNTAITVGTNAELFEQGACDVAGGLPVDLRLATDEYRRLWNNWKDHFFYVVSNEYAPAPTLKPVPGSCVDCVTVNTMTNQMAGIVIYAGSRLGTQVRTGPVSTTVPVDIDEKDSIINYIENTNESDFPDNAGNRAYVTGGGNDIMFCIGTDLAVAEC